MEGGRGREREEKEKSTRRKAGEKMQGSNEEAGGVDKEARKKKNCSSSACEGCGGVQATVSNNT